MSDHPYALIQWESIAHHKVYRRKITETLKSHSYRLWPLKCEISILMILEWEKGNNEEEIYSTEVLELHAAFCSIIYLNYVCFSNLLLICIKRHKMPFKVIVLDETCSSFYLIVSYNNQGSWCILQKILHPKRLCLQEEVQVRKFNKLQSYPHDAKIPYWWIPRRTNCYNNGDGCE